MIIIELDDGKIYRKALYLMEQKPWFPVDFLLNQPNEIVITGIKLPASSQPSLWTKNAKSLTHWCAEEPKYEMQRMTWGFAFQIYQLYKVSYIHMFVKVFYPEVWKMNWLVVSNINFYVPFIYGILWDVIRNPLTFTPCTFFKMGTASTTRWSPMSFDIDQSRAPAHIFNGNFRILIWRYCTI